MKISLHFSPFWGSFRTFLTKLLQPSWLVWLCYTLCELVKWLLFSLKMPGRKLSQIFLACPRKIYRILWQYFSMGSSNTVEKGVLDQISLENVAFLMIHNAHGISKFERFCNKDNLFKFISTMFKHFHHVYPFNDLPTNNLALLAFCGT